MRFKTWFEMELPDEPGSDEVIRTGLQPQVDAKDIHTTDKEGQEKIMALDGHFQRIADILPSLDVSSSRQKAVRNFCQNVVERWEALRSPPPEGTPVSGYMQPGADQVDWMRRNQPLPVAPGTKLS